MRSGAVTKNLHFSALDGSSVSEELSVERAWYAQVRCVIDFIVMGPTFSTSKYYQHLDSTSHTHHKLSILL